MFWPFPGFKGRTYVSPWFSTEGTLMPAGRFKETYHLHLCSFPWHLASTSHLPCWMPAALPCAVLQNNIVQWPSALLLSPNVVFSGDQLFCKAFISSIYSGISTQLVREKQKYSMWKKKYHQNKLSYWAIQAGLLTPMTFPPASLKSLGCFDFRCVLSSQWKAVTVNLRISHCQL